MPKYRITMTETQSGFADVEAPNRDEAMEMYLDEYNAGNVTWTTSTISDVDAHEKAAVCCNCFNEPDPGDILYEIPDGKTLCQDCIVKMDTHELLCFLGCKGKIAGEGGNVEHEKN